MVGTGGRTLHVIDIEYLVDGQPSGALAARALDLYDHDIDWHAGDLVVSAASHYFCERVAFDVAHRLRVMPAGGGPDAADLAILEQVEVIDLTRFDRVAVASGDHFFEHVIDLTHVAGRPAVAAGYRRNLSPRLVRAADEVVYLGEDHGYAA